MKSKLNRILLTLGVPVVALVICYLLLRAFKFQFTQIDATWTAAIAITFLITVWTITIYALHRWAPTRATQSENIKPSSSQESPHALVFKASEETVTYEVKMISLNVDVVKVNAHTHMVGIAAEHAWINFKYPNSVMMEQSLTTLELLTGKDDYKSGQVHFDIMKIRLADGREKEIYFDISSFFDGVVSSQLDKREFMAQKLLKIYGD